MQIEGRLKIREVGPVKETRNGMIPMRLETEKGIKSHEISQKAQRR